MTWSIGECVRAEALTTRLQGKVLEPGTSPLARGDCVIVALIPVPISGTSAIDSEPKVTIIPEIPEAADVLDRFRFGSLLVQVDGVAVFLATKKRRCISELHVTRRTTFFIRNLVVLRFSGI